MPPRARGVPCSLILNTFLVQHSYLDIIVTQQKRKWVFMGNPSPLLDVSLQQLLSLDLITWISFNFCMLPFQSSYQIVEEES